MPHSTVVSEVLDEYSGLTRSRMLAYLPEKEPRHYLYDLAADYPLRGGRGLRPSLCIANAKAMGGTEYAAILSAVSIELMHNALLVHDDLEDGSEMRRGRETLHELHGTPIAVNVGDTMILMSLQPLLDNTLHLGPQMAIRILNETMRMSQETAEGQAMELGWRRDNIFRLAEKDYLRMVAKKTAWLTIIHPLRVGALIGAGPQVNLDPFVSFGFFMGNAFQIQDDLLNLIGDEKKYGKELNGDIAEGKRTLMLIRLFEEATEKERKELITMFSWTRQEREQAIPAIRSLMDKYACIEYAQAVAQGMAGAAQHEFEKIYGGLSRTRDIEFLEGMIRWVITRH